MKLKSPTQQMQFKTEHGQGLVEYGMIILLVGIAAIIAVNLFEDQLRETFRDFVGTGEFAPPDIGPLGGEFTPKPGTPTPVPAEPVITKFSTVRGNQIQVVAETDIPLTVQFDVNATDEDNNITTYEVDVDSGTGAFDIAEYSWSHADNEAGGAPTHTYPAKGSYTFYLRVTDSTGLTSEAATTIIVYEDDSELPDTPPNILSIAANSTIVLIGETVDFSTSVQFDSPTDGTGATYRWSLGDGATRSGETPTYSYDAPGTYQVRLQVTENDHNPPTNDVSTLSDILEITVLTPTPSPTFTPIAK